MGKYHSWPHPKKRYIRHLHKYTRIDGYALFFTRNHFARYGIPLLQHAPAHGSRFWKTQGRTRQNDRRREPHEKKSLVAEEVI